MSLKAVTAVSAKNLWNLGTKQLRDKLALTEVEAGALNPGKWLVMLFSIVIIFVSIHCCLGLGRKKLKQASVMSAKANKTDEENPK